MLEQAPSQATMSALLGQPLMEVWQALCAAIEEKYDMDRIWNKGGKNWTYEYKYRRGGKTLCSLYAKENHMSLLVVFGKEERVKFEALRDTLSEAICKTYDEAQTFHDGKWVTFTLADMSDLGDYVKMLSTKRRPNRK